MKKLRIHYFQHVPFEGLGSIEEWAKTNGHSLTSTHFYKSYSLPHLSGFDWLIVMGGPMSVNDEKQHPWLVDEKEFLEKAIEAGKTVLGICLGSQLISTALGAKVSRNRDKEIGWFDIELSSYAQNMNLFSHMDGKMKFFHWHGDTFDLPDDAIHLASSEGCRNQAYIYNEKVLALQFHPETSIHSIKQMIENGRDELVPSKYIQVKEEQLLDSSLIKSNRDVLFPLLDKLV